MASEEGREGEASMDTGGKESPSESSLLSSDGAGATELLLRVCCCSAVPSRRVGRGAAVRLPSKGPTLITV